MDVRDDPRGGFVFFLVVLLLFAIGVAGALGYQAVLNEAMLSVYAKETQRALSIARAGLQRYVGQQVGVHQDTVTYSMEEGNAVVIARKVAEMDDYQTLYVLGSEGVYTDPTYTGSAARRTVYQYAIKKETALFHLGAVTQASGSVVLQGGSRVYGLDQANPGECDDQDPEDLVGVVMGSGSLVMSGGSVNGSPNAVDLGSMSAALDALGLDWALFTDSDFPVDYEDVWPSCALPADSFTVTRFTTPVTAPFGACGRGVLIVDGGFLPADGFTWDGVILAGHIETTTNDFTINGMVIGGLDGGGTLTTFYDASYVYYNRCNAFDAGRRLSHFELIGSTWWERT